MFFETHVKANHDDWCNDPRDERKAMNAAVSANQMADHIYHYFSENNDGQLLGATNLDEYRRALAAIQPDFALVRDVAEAHKHVHLGALRDRVACDAGQPGGSERSLWCLDRPGS